VRAAPAQELQLREMGLDRRRQGLRRRRPPSPTTADIADLSSDRGHQVLTVLGKGNRRAKVASTPGTLGALHASLR
jgi:hypothetical protein